MTTPDTGEPCTCVLVPAAMGCPVHGSPDTGETPEEGLRAALIWFLDNNPNATDAALLDGIRTLLADAALRATPSGDGLDGTRLIAAERRRQVESEGYSAAHDAGHGDDLAQAGAVYAMPPGKRTARGGLDAYPDTPVDWPWHPAYWKPTPNDRVRELVKAGALIAAAIDARLAAAEPEEGA